MRALRTALIPALLSLAACATSGKPPAAPPGEAWAPPPPAPDQWDWVRLTSGEWLKGEVKSMREKTLEFESDELDDLELDWSDVAELRSPRSLTLTFEGRQVATGPVLVEGDRVRVGGEDAAARLRADLVSIVPAGETEWNKWSGKVSLGVTARSGNTDQVDLSSHVLLRRRAAFSRVVLEYFGNYGKLGGEENVNNHRANGKWDIFLSRRWYATPASVEYFRDPFSNIDYRVTPGAGGGYHLIDDDDLTWDVGAGLGWRFTRYDSVSPGEEPKESSGAVLLGTELDYDLTKDIELEFSWKAQVGVEDIEDTNQHLVATISIDLPNDLDLDVSFIWDRVGQPRAGADGVVPKKDDFSITVGLGWDF